VNRAANHSDDPAKGLGRIDAPLIARISERNAVPDSGRPTFPVPIPFSGQTLGRIPLGTRADVTDAVEVARRAQVAWAARPFSERAGIVLRFQDMVLERRDEALDLIQIETGKARRHALEEVWDVALVARYYACHGDRVLRMRRRRGALPGLTRAWEHHHPWGVVGIIAPWNYPLSLAVTDAIPALLAGNTTILKPDRQTTYTALWASALLAEAGLPEGIFQVVSGEGPELGPALADSVDCLSFTGSTETGQKVARLAADRLLPCSLELGGKNPMLVLADADVKRAVNGALRGAFSSAGQLCVSIERLYVHADVHEAFVTRLVERTRRLRLGTALDFSVDVGCLVSADQFSKVEEHVDGALVEGASLRTGGRARPDVGPLFYEPTVLAGVKAGMRVFAEETFGPVVSVYRFDSIEEAIELANASDYGLNASIWSRDVRGARRLATRIEAGTVNVNEAYGAAWGSVDAPMGGFKRSGLGRRHGAEGILKYTQSQTVADQRLVPAALTGLPGLGETRYERLVSGAFRLLPRIPGLR